MRWLSYLARIDVRTWILTGLIALFFGSVFCVIFVSTGFFAVMLPMIGLIVAQTFEMTGGGEDWDD